MAPAGSEARRRYAAEALRWYGLVDTLESSRSGDVVIDEYIHLIRLGERARLALEAGDTARAEQWASDATRIPDVSRRVVYTPEMRGWRANPQDLSVHQAHIVLGKIALARDDVADAANHLDLAGKAASSSVPAMAAYGPDLTLAQDLLERGHREPVTSYLEACRDAWQKGRAQLDDWIRRIHGGVVPDLTVTPMVRPSLRWVLEAFSRSKGD